MDKIKEESYKTAPAVISYCDTNLFDQLKYKIKSYVHKSDALLAKGSI